MAAPPLFFFFLEVLLAQRGPSCLLSPRPLRPLLPLEPASRSFWVIPPGADGAKVYTAVKVPAQLTSSLSQPSAPLAVAYAPNSFLTVRLDWIPRRAAEAKSAR